MILGIYGAGGLGREVLEIAQKINTIEHKWSMILFIDDVKTQKLINNTTVASFAEISKIYKNHELEIVISNGEPSLRELLYKRIISAGYCLCTLIHPTTNISSHTNIGAGSIICFGVFISCNAKIGENVVIMPNSNIGHDCIIENNCVVCGMANVSGNVRVGEKSFIGLSSSIKQETYIGSNVIIGMGSVVVRDVHDGMIAMGNPAREIKENEENRVFKERNNH